MQFKQYPSYKNSGVEWLGDVPEHWDLKRFKYILEELNELSELGDETLLSVSEYYGVKPRKETIDEGDILSRAESLSGYKKCKSGDLVMNIMLAWKRGLGITKFDGIVSPAYAVFRLFSHNYSEDYIHYLLRTDTYTNYFKSFSTGVMDSRLRLYPEYFGNLTNISPSLKEQNQIVSFLNTETTRIDNLISKQEKLIELLEEQRKSIISHAVTKGLNPNAPMKDSGVEWLGDVPEHWEVISIKFLAHCSSGQGINSLEVLDIADDKNSFPVIGGNGMMGWTSKSNYKEPVLSIGRVGALCGNVHLINYPSWISDNSLILKVYSKKVNLEILQYILLSRNLNNLASKSAQPLITGTQVKNEKITLPPPNEQSQILQYIIQNQSRINNLIAKQKTLIEKLKEYRASIISHAVTGKIDVREFGA